ncbi:MAG: cupin domain-containing protein [Streptosporangiaceae bacterium]|nr:cupin domain-containing protein [Streptosporangiaceae bacterium]
MDVKNIDNPDERREFPNGHSDVLYLAGLTFAVSTYEPGWRWSEHVAKIAGTKSCQIHHNGFCMRGRARVRMDDDGSEHDFGPGDVFVIPPGHDAWVLGDEPLVLYGFTGSAALYAEAKAGGKQGSRRGFRRK